MESDIVERLRGWCPHEDECPRVLIDEAADEIERLRAKLAAAIKQRDEAQRWHCLVIAYQRKDRGEDFDPEAVAVEEGWDCFGEKEGGGD